MHGEYSVARDPLFLVAVGVFAILTTVIPAFFGQAILLILLQSVTLTILLGIALRAGAADVIGSSGAGIRVLVIWTVAQALVIGILAFFAGARMDGAIRNGFDLSHATIEWFYTDGAYPESLATSPAPRVLEFLAVTGGAYISGGLTGIWALLDAVNRTAFVSARLLANLDQGVLPLVVFFPWAILRIAGLIGLIALFAAPLWTGEWSPARLWTRQRRLLLTALLLLLLAYVLELLLPDIWRSLFI